MPITVYDLAIHRGAKEDADGCLTGEDFAEVRLPIFGGCECCGASLAAYNAYPASSGFLRCSDCIGTRGWEDVQQANIIIFADEFDKED